MYRTKILLAVFLTVISTSAALADQLIGADFINELYAPVYAGRGGFTTSRWSASSVNPAAGGEAQLLTFDAAYMGMFDINNPGFGHAAAIGALLPTKFASFGAGLRFLHSPFNNFSLGTTFGGNLNIAKEIYTGMSFGAAVNFGFGSDWTVFGDLGFRYNMGRLAFMDNFTVAAAIKNLGKSYPAVAFTPLVGVAMDLVSIKTEKNPDAFRLNLALDLGFPGFVNMSGKVGLSVSIADVVFIGATTGFNIKEYVDGYRSFPNFSAGIGAKFALKSSGKVIAGGIPADGNIAVNLAYKPLVDSIMGIGAGVTWTAGVMDKEPPVISINYPEAAYISPNNDGRADNLELQVSITDSRYVMEWSFDIQNESGEVVRSIQNKERRAETETVKSFFSRFIQPRSGVYIPPVMSWDGVMDSGSIAPDGRYFFVISAADDNDNRGSTQRYEVFVDNTPPEIVLRQPAGTDKIFSPGAGSRRDSITLTQSGSTEDKWDAGIYDAAGTKVRNFDVENGSPANIIWNGRDDAGQVVPDGIYSYRISATDPALNTESAAVENIIVNTQATTAFFTASTNAIAPREGSAFQAVNFNLILSLKEGISNWSVEIKDEEGTVRRRFPAPGTAGQRVPPDAITWNGRDEAGQVNEGRYTATIKIEYEKGDYIEQNAGPVTVDISGPKLGFITRPDYFSPDNDGVEDELFISLSADDLSPIAAWSFEITEPVPPNLQFWRIEGRGTPSERIVWNGRSNRGELVQAATDYPAVYRATDSLGNSSEIRGTIGIDVMVIRDGNLLRIQVPSIIFQENASGFENVAKDAAANNVRVLRRIAAILNKFKDYKITVEGHANPVLRTAAEERNELQPLSEARARAIVEWLTKNGVARNRLSYVGMGGTRPVVSFEDRNNWWKNRRVEFILNK